MADLLSTLSTSYATATPRTSTRYVAVDAKAYIGSWEGRYADNSKFKFEVSQVEGFRAKVKYQSGATVKYQDVLIKDQSFRVGDSKFTLTRDNKATIKTVLTNPANGNTSLETAYATRSA